MPQTTAFQPTQDTKQPLKCKTCPFFTGFNGEERGLCHVFGEVSKRNHLRTSDCDHSIESLLKQSKTYTVKVELITEAVEDDGSGHGVPIDSCTEEIMVAQPLLGLVEAEIAARKDLQGWEVATFWQLNPEEEFEI